VYDARMVEGLRDLGWKVRVHNLRGRFPDPDAVAREELESALAGMRDATRVIVDGLAMGGLPDVVRAHATRLRIISMVHHPLAEETGLSADEQASLAESERRALGACAGVIVSSAYTARRLQAYGVTADRVRVVVPGTAAARPAVGPAPGEPPMLLCVASVTPRKGHDVLVAALARVRDLPWACVCAGSLGRDPAFAHTVLRAVADAGLGERMDFVGERQGDLLEELYQRASLFVLASHYEGYGMALAEAIAHGLPIVSTTGGAIPYTVPAETGLLVPPGDAEALAGALRALLASGGPGAAELSAAARRHAERLPSWATSVARFAEAILELTP
jgi:glycosyltransferase involved in cell wall biosynthesis